MMMNGNGNSIAPENVVPQDQNVVVTEVQQQQPPDVQDQQQQQIQMQQAPQQQETFMKNEQQQEPSQNDYQQPQQQQQPIQFENTQTQSAPQHTFTALPTAVTQRPDSGCFLRCRGLPYSASENDVRKFFGEFTILDVSFTSSVEGKPTGECYVQFTDREQASKGQLKDRQTMGSRYIEVFQVSEIEMDQLVKRLQMKRTLSAKGFVRIRGLPYTCTKENVQQFFRGLAVEEVVFGKEPGIEGRPTGEGFVKFNTADEADRALQLNGQHMGNRYLEIFKSDGAAFEAFKTRSQNNIVPLKALAQDPWSSYGPGGYGGGGGGYGGGHGGYGAGYEQRAGGRPMGRGSYDYDDQGGSHRYSPYPNYGNYGYGHGERGGGFGGRGGRGRGRGGGGGGGGGGGYMDDGGGYGGGGGYAGGGGGYNDNLVGPNKIYMRGIPFRISGAELERFFAPLICVDIQVGTMPDGRSSGDGVVEFQSPAEARQALSKDRECIGNRYIELFPTMTAKIPSHVTYDSIGGKGGGQRAPSIPTPAQQYAQAVQQQVAAYASGNYPQQPHQYGQYGAADYSTNYYGAYGSSADAGQQGGPKTDYNWPASQF